MMVKYALKLHVREALMIVLTKIQTAIHQQSIPPLSGGNTLPSEGKRY
jgi:hypothetical protein